LRVRWWQKGEELFISWYKLVVHIKTTALAVVKSDCTYEIGGEGEIAATLHFVNELSVRFAHF
jgi:hypothetical protein